MTTTTPTPACADVELLLSLRASGPGALDAEESARVDAHLAACAACRAEADATAATLSAARLPPPSDADRRALGGLSTSLLEELRRRERRRGFLRPFLAGAAVAAAVAAFLVAPALLRKAPSVATAGQAALALGPGGVAGPGAEPAAGDASARGAGVPGGAAVDPYGGAYGASTGTAPGGEAWGGAGSGNAVTAGGTGPAAGNGSAGAAALASSWEPDLDSLWDDTVVLDWSETTASAASGYGQASYGYDSGYTTNAAFDR